MTCSTLNSIDGTVELAGVGNEDDDNHINGDAQTAFNHLGTSMDKRFTLARALFEAAGSIQMTLSTALDFAPHAVNYNAAPSYIVSTRTPSATADAATGRK